MCGTELCTDNSLYCWSVTRGERCPMTQCIGDGNRILGSQDIPFLIGITRQFSNGAVLQLGISLGSKAELGTQLAEDKSVCSLQWWISSSFFFPSCPGPSPFRSRSQPFSPLLPPPPLDVSVRLCSDIAFAKHPLTMATEAPKQYVVGFGVHSHFEQQAFNKSW